MTEWIVLGILEDFRFVFQIIILLTIANFVLNHMGKTWTAYLTIGIVCAVVFFVIPTLAQGVFLLYLLLMAGVSTMLVDFFFITAGASPQQPGGAPGAQEEGVTGTELAERMKKMQHGPGHGAIAHRAAGAVQNAMMRMRR